MPGFHLNEIGEMVLDEVDDIGVVDVYDLASDIGKECEKIIDHFGPEAVTGLMPRVINALELLEALATKNEKENTTIQELTDRITQLESEKLEKAEFRKRFEKEIELIEDQWRTETRELVDLVNSLQEENKRIIKQQQDLQSASAHSSGLGNSLTDSIMSITNIELSNALTDTQILQRLKEQIHKQRDEIKTKERELQEKVVDIENLNIQIERLTNSGRDSRRRQKMLQVQVKTLCEERADFLAQLQDQHREINQLKKRLGMAEKENEDLANSLEYENEDPNRPRYTTGELKELLNERDELLTKIDDLTEELRKYKPDSIDEPDDIEENEPPKFETPPDEDAPVQGPLPYEWYNPDEKKPTESGIRRFFRKLFSDPDSTIFPRRSLSTLSKMALSAGPNPNVSTFN